MSLNVLLFLQGYVIFTPDSPRHLPLLQASKLTHSPTQPPTQGYGVFISSEKTDRV